eukprot:TRINITY_DN12156_c0_g1_i3.p1 TRINITY_DN12156_c0_g1~~TRINITY_DN12156_c0_g1_i3.p1  ORF type:complete len:133 (+),score=31.42 TRINITY_DN12156_c0_g1_i3:60-458(+)
MVECMFFFFFFKQKTAYEMQRGLVGSEMCIRDRNGRTLYGCKHKTKYFKIAQEQSSFFFDESRRTLIENGIQKKNVLSFSKIAQLPSPFDCVILSFSSLVCSLSLRLKIKRPSYFGFLIGVLLASETACSTN